MSEEPIKGDNKKSSRVQTKRLRYPTLPLEEVVAKVNQIFEEEGPEPMATEVAIQAIGYTNTRSGAAGLTMAALRLFGLLEVPKRAYVQVAEEFKDFLYHPDEAEKARIAEHWLRTPKAFSDVLKEHPLDRMPSARNLKYELVQKGLSPPKADECITTLEQSIAFVRRLYRDAELIETDPDDGDPYHPESGSSESVEGQMHATLAPVTGDATGSVTAPPSRQTAPDMESIPVRLKGGRRAIIQLPTPLYESDKAVIIAMLSAVITDDDEGGEQV